MEQVTDFAMQPEFMSALTGGFEGATAGITSAYSAATPAVVSGFCIPLGPLAVGNMIPQVCSTMTTNCASGMLNAATHAALGVGTTASAAAFTAADGV